MLTAGAMMLTDPTAKETKYTLLRKHPLERDSYLSTRRVL